MSRILRVWLPAIFWLGVIAWESIHLSSNVTGDWLQRLLATFDLSLPDEMFDVLHHMLRKTGHFAGYGVLTLLFFRAWFYTLHRDHSILRFRLRCAALALTVTLFTAMADEWHQSFDLTRTGTSKDVALDMAGGITAQILALGIYAAWKRNGAEAAS